MIERIKSNADSLFTTALVLTDAVLIGLAFYIAYQLRLVIHWPTPPEHIGVFAEYLGMMVIQILSVLTAAT